MTGVYICGGTYRHQQIHMKCQGKCATDNARVVVMEGSPYYDPILGCVECGDSWCGGELSQRPFRRGWRQQAIARHQRLWDAGCPCPIERDRDFYPLPCGTHERGI